MPFGESNMLARSVSSMTGLRKCTSSWCARKFSRAAFLNNVEKGASPENSENVPNVETTSISSNRGFAKAIAKMEGHESFPKMIKFSPLMQMGDPQGKIVEGTIVHVVDDDLYIDFGAKFNCVCPRPQKNGGSYTLGKKVRLMVHDLELSTRFLGAKTDLTILEADCSLLGLARLEKQTL